MATANKSDRVRLYQLAQRATGKGTILDNALAGAVVDYMPAITDVCCIYIFVWILFLQQAVFAAPWVRFL